MNKARKLIESVVNGESPDSLIEGSTLYFSFRNNHGWGIYNDGQDLEDALMELFQDVEDEYGFRYPWDTGFIKIANERMKQERVPRDYIKRTIAWLKAGAQEDEL